ncbi:hypothetical protein ACLEPN_03280 [Myxococcus sp. 1LA]
MGMVLLAGFMLAVFGGCVVGGGAALIHLFAMRKGLGSWKYFLMITGAVTVAIAVGALSWMFGTPEYSGSGAPSGDSYERFIFGAMLLGSSPGWGGLAGLLALLHRHDPGASSVPTGGRA